MSYVKKKDEQTSFQIRSATPSRVPLKIGYERSSDRCPDRVASINELSLVTDMLVKVIKQFLGNLNADLRHTVAFAEEYF